MHCSDVVSRECRGHYSGLLSAVQCSALNQDSLSTGQNTAPPSPGLDITWGEEYNWSRGPWELQLTLILLGLPKHFFFKDSRTLSGCLEKVNS